MAVTSLRQRYIISAALLVAVILVMLVWASMSVRDASDKSLGHVDIRRQVQLTSSNLRDGIWQTDFFVNAYLLTPTADNRNKLLSSLNGLNINISTLSDNTWASTPDRQLLLKQLDEKINTMRQEIDALIDILGDREKAIPLLHDHS